MLNGVLSRINIRLTRGILHLDMLKLKKLRRAGVKISSPECEYDNYSCVRIRDTQKVTRLPAGRPGFDPR